MWYNFGVLVCMGWCVIFSRVRFHTRPAWRPSGPFLLSSPRTAAEAAERRPQLARCTLQRWTFDAGAVSEPLMYRSLFIEWWATRAAPPPPRGFSLGTHLPGLCAGAYLSLLSVCVHVHGVCDCLPDDLHLLTPYNWHVRWSEPNTFTTQPAPPPCAVSRGTLCCVWCGEGGGGGLLPRLLPWSIRAGGGGPHPLLRPRMLFSASVFIGVLFWANIEPFLASFGVLLGNCTACTE